MIQEQNYRIERDPNDAQKWAYTLTFNYEPIKTVGGFKTSDDAKRALKKAQRQT